ncbi:MAG TPA: 16S rRNA (cytidine(1402)-2'-O)-methyltransferase [Candidatus Tumulicola sp.]
MPLIFVPTPLGNLRDVTLRALDALRDADLIVAEDTRVARKLLSALNLPSKPCWSYRDQNARTVTAGILERARTESVVVTSDAGMPGVSDPGAELIAAARVAGVPIDVLPGPSAAFGTAVLSGFPLDRFTFEGFAGRTARERTSGFDRALRSGATSIWYESPRRILSTLDALAKLAPDVTVFLVREYTKMHEQQLLGTPATVAAALPDPVRGEIAFALAPYLGAAGESHTSVGDRTVDEAIDSLLQSGERTNAIAKELAARGLGGRTELYARVVERKRGKGETPPGERRAR